MNMPSSPDRPTRVAIVLFNLGGPDQPSAIKPFLLNLFRDPAILRVPFFVRPLLARIIATLRVAPATANYAILGGRSPLLELTERQARSLEIELECQNRLGGRAFVASCFIAMRYWHPFARETVREVKAFGPDRVLLLPLYPQYSTTTTGSSLTDWREQAAVAGLVAPVTTLCCWHSDPGFVAATASLVRSAIRDARRAVGDGGRLRILYSAHGLPEVIVRKGDPYQFQVERSAAAVARALLAEGDPDSAMQDWLVCYQSRATPQQWLTPSTEDEIVRAGREGVGLVIVPIAFVSDHSETLVELDVEYAETARHAGVPAYVRAAVPNDDPGFVHALALTVSQALHRGEGLCSFRGGAVCPRRFGDCPHARAGKRSAAVLPTEAVDVAE